MILDDIYSPQYRCRMFGASVGTYFRRRRRIEAPLCFFDQDVCVDRPVRSLVMWPLEVLEAVLHLHCGPADLE